MSVFENRIDQILAKQRHFQYNQVAKSVEYRKNSLKKLKETILRYETEITDALYKDLHKSKEEAYLTEISLVLNDIDYHIKHISKWVKPQKVKTPIFVLPSKSRLLYEPLGVALIIAPWNYPFQLMLNPLIGAISSGCSVIMKPAPETPATVNVIKKIISEVFIEDHVAVVEPTMEENEILLSKRYDLIFFTGSPRVGKIIARAAAEHLTPIILELGGKSPCIIDAKSNVEVAAKRVVFGKLINAGQTCIAPDYFFVHTSVKTAFIDALKKHITSMYSSNTKELAHYPRMVHARATERVSQMIDPSKVVFGGDFSVSERYIQPTILDNVTKDDAVMQEEIFGPIFPILTFDKMETVLSHIKTNEKPLALYYFGDPKEGMQIFQKTSSGGGCINDTLMHITNHHVPFGGVGNSGMGGYHGFYSFKAFSNQRAIIITPTWVDIPLKYAPFKHFNLIKKIM